MDLSVFFYSIYTTNYIKYYNMSLNTATKTGNKNGTCAETCRPIQELHPLEI
jgi:hypothetical protein